MGVDVLSALGFRSGFTHMERYRKADAKRSSARSERARQEPEW